MSETVIEVENLSKKYIISHQKASEYGSLREKITDGFKSIGNSFRQKSEISSKEEFWALKDISFQVKQGDRIGIIGRNGAGKSTLLKILSRITEPTAGQISIKGRVASLLEVGTGFHPELTGRENIFLNGAILGMSRTEIIRKFDEIVDFAEVEKFLDTPVKRYSSGMYVRLAFAVAAHLEPEILVIDEVLAVGDTQFQKKCLGKMNKFAEDGRTILFVSHNMTAINSLCSKGITLSKGNIVCLGSTSECIKVYEEQNFESQGKKWIRPLEREKSNLCIQEITLEVTGEQPNLYLELLIFLETFETHKPAFLAVDILDSAGVPIMQALPQLEGFLSDKNAKHLVKFFIQLPPLVPGQYLVTVWAGSHNTETLDEVKEAVNFDVCVSPTIGRSFPHTKDHGYIVPFSKVKILNPW